MACEDMPQLKLRDAIDMRASVTAAFGDELDLTWLLRNLAGQNVTVFDLIRKVAEFCEQHGLSERQAEMFDCVLSRDQYMQFAILAERLRRQLEDGR